MNLILCGMMGAGKTTVGIKIAEKTGRQWLDTDALITQKYGKIADIFAEKGEKYFRDLETETLKAFAQTDNLVISVGGGLVLREENVALLKQKGKLVYLQADKQTLISRLLQDEERPLLQGEGLDEKIENLLSTRAPIYEKVADYVVQVDEKTPDEIVGEVLRILSKKS